MSKIGEYLGKLISFSTEGGKETNTTANENKEIKSLMIKANSIFDQVNSRNLFYQNTDQDELYTALGLPKLGQIQPMDYVNRYKRQEVANRVVNAPVFGSWRYKPRVYETRKGDTSFEKEYEEIAEKLKVYAVLRKTDLLAALQQYSILYIGVDDNQDPEQPVNNSKQVLFLTPIPQDRADINTWDQDPRSPRYGLPQTYTVTINEDVVDSMTRVVHWSRVIHVAENTLDSEIYGIPFLEPVFNRLIGLDKLAGGSPEMFWRGARPGYTATSNENAMMASEQQIDTIKSQLSSFVNNMQRWMYIEGVDVKSLSPQVVSPKDHIEMQLKLISSSTRIPVRILTGSERGELASSQDERGWLSFLEERRQMICEDLILRPFVDRLIRLGAVSSPKDGKYHIEWEPLLVLSEKERAEIGEVKTKTLKAYVETPGAELLVPHESFMTSTLGYEEEEAEEMLNKAATELRLEDSLRQTEEENPVVTKKETPPSKGEK